MRLPYVIDNQTSRLADVIASLLAEHRGKSLDVATAYFTVGGFGLIQKDCTILAICASYWAQSPQLASKSVSVRSPASSRG